jgi:uncharacterized membrane protein YhdT
MRAITLAERQVAVWLITRSGYASTIAPGATELPRDFEARIFCAIVIPILISI